MPVDLSLTDPLVMLAAFALLVFVGFVGNQIFAKLRFNDVLLLMALGVALGPVLQWVDPDSVRPLAAVAGPVALILILFDGGLALKFRDFVSGLGPAFALAVLGFGLTVASVAAVLINETSLGWMQALTFGCIVGGTSSVIVMSSLAYIRSNRRTDTALALESAITDILVVVAVFTLVEIVIDDATPTAEQVGSMIGLLFGVSLALGALAGFLWIFFVPMVRDHPFGYMLTLAAAFALYVATEYLLQDVSGGGGALAVLAFGIILGNGATMGPRMRKWVGEDFGPGIKRFQGEVAFLVRTFFFIQLGVLIDPAVFGERATIVIGLGLFAAIAISRYVAVMLTVGRVFLGLEGWVMWFMMPRGLAAAVMAGIPAALGMAGSENFVAYAFIVVFASNIVTTVGGFLLGGKKPADDRDRPIAFTPSRAVAMSPQIQRGRKPGQL